MNNDPLNPLAGPLGKAAVNLLAPIPEQYYENNYPVNANLITNVGFHTPLHQDDAGPANQLNTNSKNHSFTTSISTNKTWNDGLLPKPFILR